MSRRRTLVVALWVLSACLLLQPVAEAAAAKRVFGSRALHQGSKGRDVRVLQDFLTRWGVITHVDGRLRAQSPPAACARGSASRSRPINGRMSLPDTVELRRAVEAGEYRPGPPARPRRWCRAVARRRPTAALAPDGTAVAPAGAPEVGRGHDRRGERDPRLPVQVRRRPRPLERHGLRLLRLHVLRAARRGPAQDGPRLVGLHELGRAGPGDVGHPLRQPRPLLHGHRRPAVRHERPRRGQLPLGHRRCGRPAATPSATQPVSRRPRVRTGARAAPIGPGPPPPMFGWRRGSIWGTPCGMRRWLLPVLAVLAVGGGACGDDEAARLRLDDARRATGRRAAAGGPGRAGARRAGPAARRASTRRKADARRARPVLRGLGARAAARRRRAGRGLLHRAGHRGPGRRGAAGDGGGRAALPRPAALRRAPARRSGARAATSSPPSA